MSRCLVGREVLIAVRPKRRGKPNLFMVVCPAVWSKSQLLRYARSEHPEDSVRIVEWHPSGKDGDRWNPKLWIANPSGFRDYARAIREAS